MPKRRRMHVIHENKQWKAKWEGGERASASGSTQAEIERRAKEIVTNAGGGEVVTHNRKGKIRDSDTIAPAKDPNPPKDNKH